MAEYNMVTMSQNIAKKVMQELRDNGLFVSRWIPVSERLPEVMYGSGSESSDDVLICVKSDDDENATISTGFYGYYPCDQSEQGWWSVWAFGCKKIEEEVIAWMPLPKPYKAESEERE